MAKDKMACAGLLQSAGERRTALCQEAELLGGGYKSLAKAQREKDLLKTLRHKHIVSYFAHAMDKDFIYVALEPFIRMPLAAERKVTSMTLKQPTVDGKQN